MSAIHFSNFQLEPDTEYFIYIGELKNYGLNLFLEEALSRIFNRRFRFIAVVPDIFEQYNYDNLIVINPRVKTEACRYDAPFSCRVSAREFMQCVSESRQIESLIRRLLNRQRTVYLYMYESLPEMTLERIPGVRVLGPQSSVAHRLNSKTYQYRHLDGVVPMVEYRICNGLESAVATADTLWQRWPDGIFVSSEYSAAGLNSTIAFDSTHIRSKFRSEKGPYLLTRYVPHQYDPTVLAVVANAAEVYVAGIADQRIEGGNRFTGSTFPSVLPAGIQEQLRNHTATIGRWLGREGYRGIFGCDYIVTSDDRIHFMEINARKQGTTLEFCCTLEQALPREAPNLPELEYYAVEEEILPINRVEIADGGNNLHWGTFNYKLSQAVRTNGYIPQSSHERDAFRKISEGRLKKDFLILEHIGSDFVVTGGSFLARVVALGSDPESVSQGLAQGKKTIDLTIHDITL